MRRKKDNMWKIRHKQRTLFFRLMRPRPKHKKIIEPPKRNAFGPCSMVRRISYGGYENQNSRFQKDAKRLALIEKSRLDTMLRYLFDDAKSPLNIRSVYACHYKNRGVLKVPKDFSIISNANESFWLLRQVVSVLFIENCKTLSLDYSDCHHVELGTQVLLDIILKGYKCFTDGLKKSNVPYRRLFAKNIGGKNIFDYRVQKLIFSIGSPVSLNLGRHDYMNVEKSELIRHIEGKTTDGLSPVCQNEIEITILTEYVINSMDKMGRTLTDQQIESLSCIIGEILINAEEHSSTNNRFSVGYFLKENVDGRNVGLFRLMIMNLGESIYEKFKDGKCKNTEVVKKMEALSRKYTQKRWFRQAKFDEGCLWTLYALQEGVTSVVQEGKKRGNGSIRFIDNFFKLKGNEGCDGSSQMHIISGNTLITFDGTYAIQHKQNDKGEEFSVMTFNESGNIEDAPDSKYVCHYKEHFPGTMISISLRLDDYSLIN